MQRRQFIAAGLAGLGVGLGNAARGLCDTIDHGFGDVEYVVRNVQPGLQNCDYWCWAASIEAIFGAAGYDVPQEDIAAAIKGRDWLGRAVCGAALDGEMLDAIQKTYRSTDGRLFRGAAYQALRRSDGGLNPFWWNVLKVELENGRPLLASYDTSPTSGHAVVVTGLRLQHMIGGASVQSITVRDPWPANPRVRHLSYQEATNLAFMAAVTARPV